MHTHRSRNEQRSTVCSGHFPLLMSVPSSSRTHTKNPWRLITSCDLGGALLGEARAPGVRFPAHASPTSACLEGRGLRGICSRVLSGSGRSWKREPCAPPLRLRPVPSQLHRPEVPGPRRRPARAGSRDVSWIGARPDHVQQRRRAGARPALRGTAGPGVPAHPRRPVQSGADGKKSGVEPGDRYTGLHLAQTLGAPCAPLMPQCPPRKFREQPTGSLAPSLLQLPPYGAQLASPPKPGVRVPPRLPSSSPGRTSRTRAGGGRVSCYPLPSPGSARAPAREGRARRQEGSA